MRPCKVFGPNRTKMFHVKHFGTIERADRSFLMPVGMMRAIAGTSDNDRLLLTEIRFQNRRINLRQSLDVGDRDMLVHHVRGRADEAEFEDWAIGTDKTRIRRSAGGRKRRAASCFRFDDLSNKFRESVGLRQKRNRIARLEFESEFRNGIVRALRVYIGMRRYRRGR
jgi:hypothetical protein